MSATNPAQVAPTLGVILKVFFVDLLTRKFPYAILFSLAKNYSTVKRYAHSSCAWHVHV